MTDIEFGGLLFVVCLVLIALRMPVAVAMFAVGGFGFASLAGWSAFFLFSACSTPGRSAGRRAIPSGPFFVHSVIVQS